MFSDDSIGAVVNHQTEAVRATTPQMKIKQRKRTPQRAGSAPRSSSANKVSALAKACFDSQSCNRSLSRTAGRKKQQKWENDNLFGLNMFMKRVDALNKQHHCDSDEEWDGGGGIDGKPLTSQGLSLNWKSLFGTLNNGDNDDALEAYLKCSNSYQTVQRGGGKGGSRCIGDCRSEWERAEFAWLKVEKRLRTILLQALGDRQGGGKEARGFVTAIEELLLVLEKEQQKGGEEGEGEGEGVVLPTSPATAHLFPRPPRLVRPSSPTLSREDTDAGEGDAAVILRVAPRHLVVTLLDSAFHRLLLHATCQFHHMHSKSFTDKTKTKGKSKSKSSSGSNSKKHVRATRISPFQSQQGAHSISLVPFVLLKLSALDEERRAGGAGERKHKKNDKKGPSQRDKENSPRNRQTQGLHQREDEEDEESVLNLDDLALEEKKSEVEEEEVEVEEEDEDEYCLVDIVTSSSAGNPIESREN